MTLVVALYNNFKWEADAMKFAEFVYNDVKSYEVVGDMLVIEYQDGSVDKLYDSITEVMCESH